MEMAAMTNALLLIMFALLGSGTANGDRQANIPVRQLNNGTWKNSANSYVMSVQYSHGSSPHLTPERPAQNSVVRSSNSTTQMGISTPRPAVPNIKVFPTRIATSPMETANVTSPASKANVKAEVSATHKSTNTVAVANVQVSSTPQATNPATVNTKSTVTQMQQFAVQKPSSQQTVTEVTYPDSFISAQIAAASLTTPSPDTYVNPVALQQQIAASSYSSWNIQPQTTIDRSYSVVNPVYVKPAALQQTPVQSSSWQLQSQPHTDVSYATLNAGYAKPDVLQQPIAATSTSGWQLQQTQTPVDRSYSVVNPAYGNSVVLQPTAIPQANWQLQQQLHGPIDRAYSSTSPLRYYPYNTLRQSTLVEPYIDKRNQKYKQYSLSRSPSQHIHGSYPAHSVHSHPYSSYYSRRPPIERENPPFFKPYPTKYVNFAPNRFPTPYNGLLNFSRHRPSYKDSPFSSGSSGSMYYKILLPLALLGISIPALGMMYTYLSKRRRRRSADDLFPSVEDIEHYMQMLQKAVETYQPNDFAKHS